MAPVGMVGVMSWFSSPEVVIISLVAFLILSITLLALCAKCHRGSSNAYDVSGTKTNGAGENGDTDKRSEETNGPETAVYSEWRSHNDMPPSTLQRAQTTPN
ncbi:uncharacterized protein PAE49_002443 [Odontesthes bonariensis]